MKISIVTVSYNQARFLEEAMDSVLRQAYPELEYIVVDPGSQDGSRALIDARAQGLALRIYESDRGAADGLNKGFSHATGEVFGFLNADDVLRPGALRAVAQFFTEHAECDVVFGNGHKIDEHGNRARHLRAARCSEMNFLYGGAVWLQQATFFRAETFRRSPGFNMDNRTSWDGELFIHMLHDGARVGYIDADLAAFRVHGGSITGSGRLNRQYLKDRQRVFEEVRGRQWGIADEARHLIHRGVGFAQRLMTGRRTDQEA